VTSDPDNEYDSVSDELISLMCDETAKPSDRKQATEDLYNRHKRWVADEISRRISNSSDTQDISQRVWMRILPQEYLAKHYKHKNGQFRSFLRNPINWEILRHYEKTAFSINEAGEKVPARFVEINESRLDRALDDALYDNAMENIIKPNLRAVNLKSRTVFVLNEYHAIFESRPSVLAVASINGISNKLVDTLLERSKGKLPSECSDEEMSVHIPSRYDILVDEQQVRSSGIKYLSSLIGVAHSTYRNRLYVANKELKEIVRENLDKGIGVGHG